MRYKQEYSYSASALHGMPRIPHQLTGVTLRGLSTASGHARPSDAALRIPAQQMSHVANPRTRHLRSVHVAHWHAMARDKR